jgi:acetyl esterase
MLRGFLERLRTMTTMRTLVTLVPLLGLGAWVSAQSQNAIDPVWEEKIYKEVDGQSLRAFVFPAAAGQDAGAHPAIAFFHGGGWVFGRPQEFFGACERFARLGFTTISFQYRLSVNADGTWPKPGVSPIESVKDARSAIRWMRANAAALDIDPDRIVVAGQSAGGQLALATALIEINESTDDLNVSPAPNALLLYSSNVNTLEPWVDMLLGDRSAASIFAISPYHHVRKHMPPAIAFRGLQDDQVPRYVVDLFKRRMDEFGNRFEVVSYPGRKHYLGVGNEKYATYFDEEIMERTDAFLRELGFMP